MSGRTHFWLGSLMLALAVGILVGGLACPRPTYSQDAGEGRTGNYALVASTLRGTQTKSQIVYVVDDRTEALYVLETSSIKGEHPSLMGFRDLRELSTDVQKARARKDTKHPNAP